MAGHKFIPEMRLRQLGFTYSAYELFNKNKERTQKFKETGDSIDIYQDGLDKLAFTSTRLIEILKIYLEEQYLIKYYVTKHLTLLKIQNMVDIKEVLL